MLKAWTSQLDFLLLLPFCAYEPATCTLCLSLFAYSAVCMATKQQAVPDFDQQPGLKLPG